MPDRKIHGLYLLTDERYLGTAVYLSTIERCLKAGVDVLQFRNKSFSLEERKRVALWLKEMCARHNVPFIVNDSATLAAEVGADGVHIGESEIEFAVARKIVGDKAIIGVSCEGSIESAKRLQDSGANYVSFGACFKSPTKPESPIINLAMLAEAKQSLKVPVVAIGGITPKNADAVLRTGVDAIAVISGVLKANNPANAVKAYKEVFLRLAQPAATG
ncbi:MAG: thiamine phosphate synthase [bacterium]